MTLTELSRRERKKEETRRRIFEAAISLFRERGFESTTVDDITEKADVGRGTFFNYFPKKEAVLAYLSEERVAHAEENAAALLEDQAPAREKLHEIYAFAASAYVADRELSRYVFEEWMRQAFAPTADAGNRWERLIVRVIEQGQATGELRADTPAMLIESLLSSVYMTTLYLWLCCSTGLASAGAPGAEASFPLLDSLRTRIDLVLDGVATRGGRA
jgi:AcrR family transcriptional regulator